MHYKKYSMATKNITDESFDTDVLKASKPTLVDFWAEWCGPCIQVGPILEEISKLNKQAARFELLVEETEKKISEIESKFGIENFFQITSREEVNKLKAEKIRLSKQLSEHLKQWEISSQNLENAKEQFDL